MTSWCRYCRRERARPDSRARVWGADGRGACAAQFDDDSQCLVCATANAELQAVQKMYERSPFFPSMAVKAVTPETFANSQWFLRSSSTMHAYAQSCRRARARTLYESWMHIYTHECACVRMHACMHPSINTSIHIYMHACMHTYIHTCVHTGCGGATPSRNRAPLHPHAPPR